MQIIDLTLTIDNECMTCNAPWHEKVQIARMGLLEEVGRNTSKFRLGSHTATHMDAPLHFFEGAPGIDETDLEKCIGPVTCVDMTHIKAGQVVQLKDVESVKVTERMLFAFGWYKNWKTENYYKAFPYFSQEAIEYLVDNGMLFMAMDTPSPDDGSAIQKKDDSPMHKILLGKGIVIVEYLNQTELIDYGKNYEIIALPLKIKGADGAPARVVLKEI
ncbi:MAG: cyclase family protein [Lachnospiraceae bacterium]|nr:cyclase family protein [Lachnospiraceae bacterium]